MTEIQTHQPSADELAIIPDMEEGYQRPPSFSDQHPELDDVMAVSAPAEQAMPETPPHTSVWERMPEPRDPYDPNGARAAFWEDISDSNQGDDELGEQVGVDTEAMPETPSATPQVVPEVSPLVWKEEEPKDKGVAAVSPIEWRPAELDEFETNGGSESDDNPTEIVKAVRPVAEADVTTELPVKEKPHINVPSPDGVPAAKPDEITQEIPVIEVEPENAAPTNSAGSRFARIKTRVGNIIDERDASRAAKSAAETRMPGDGMV